MRIAKRQERTDSHVLRDILSLVDCVVPLRIIREWTDEQASMAERWAAKTHLRASDNPVRVPPRPDFLEPYADYEQRHGYPTARKLMRTGEPK